MMKEYSTMYGIIKGVLNEKCYPDGTLKECCLQEALEIKTPLGDMKAEAVTFYEDGSLKSLSLLEEEKIKVRTIYGVIIGRLGISFYKSGKIKSLEPLYPPNIPTVIGDLSAYDNNPIGIHGDSNSLCFYEDGRVKSLVTTLSGIRVITDKTEEMFEPVLNEKEIVPIWVEFAEDTINIKDTNGLIHSYETEECDFFSYQVKLEGGGSCGGSCEGCKGCHK